MTIQELMKYLSRCEKIPFTTESQLLAVLNLDPDPSWIEENPMIKVKNDKGKDVPARYVSYGVMQQLTQILFGLPSIEIKDEKIVINSYKVSVRVHLENPVTDKILFVDGMGAVPFQLDSGAAPNDISKIKKTAVQMGAPAAYTYAIKNALAKLGRIFGADLNRYNSEDLFESYELITQFKDNLAVQNVMELPAKPEFPKERFDKLVAFLGNDKELAEKRLNEYKSKLTNYSFSEPQKQILKEYVSETTIASL